MGGTRLARVPPFLLILPVFEDQPGSSPATSLISRPVATNSGRSSRMSGSPSDRAAWSSPLISSQFSRFSRGLPAMRTRCQRPPSFSP